MVKVTVNGTCREYEDGITYETLAQEHQQEYEHRIILAVAGGKIKELHKKVDKDVTVTFQTLSDRVGHDTYVRSAVMLLIKAISDVAGSPEEGEVSVEFTIGRGLYCVPKGRLAERVVIADGEEERQMEAEFVDRVKERMAEMVAAGLPITKKAYPTDERSRFSKHREWMIRSGCSAIGEALILTFTAWTGIMTIITAIWCRIPAICSISICFPIRRE